MVLVPRTQGLRIGRRALGAFATALAAGATWAFARRSRNEHAPDDETTVRTMVTAVECVIGMPIERSHYETYFGWRLRNLHHAAARYRDAASALEAIARREVGAPFSKASEPDRARFCSTLDPALRREILDLFAATDAWIALGYGGWPGMARGFEDYRKRPQ